jgi:hypothetical protein
MKLVLVSLLSLLASHSANATITSVYSVTAQVQFDGKEAIHLVKALENAGYVPRDDGYIGLTNINVDARSNDKDHDDPSDPCYLKPQFTTSFTYETFGNANDGKTVTINPNQDCTGEDNAKAEAIYNAVNVLGADGDAAMGGVFGTAVTDLGCYKDIKGNLNCSIVIPKEVKLK